jgi:hypothetical protein
MDEEHAPADTDTAADDEAASAAASAQVAATAAAGAVALAETQAAETMAEAAAAVEDVTNGERDQWQAIETLRATQAEMRTETMSSFRSLSEQLQMLQESMASALKSPEPAAEPELPQTQPEEVKPPKKSPKENTPKGLRFRRL